MTCFRILSLLGLLAVQVSAQGAPLGNASVVTNNPTNAGFTATLPSNAFFNLGCSDCNIKGSVSGTSSVNGTGVVFQVNFSNLPPSGGPFLYHIHDAPVPVDGNCTGTLGHLDPYNRGETPPCDASVPQTCQVGDLSGKYGKITSDPFVATYVDDYTSTNPSDNSYFGNRSITVHFANATRITCANFTQIATGGGGGYNSTNTTVSPVPSATAQGTSAASQSDHEFACALMLVVGAMVLIM